MEKSDGLGEVRGNFFPRHLPIKSIRSQSQTPPLPFSPPRSTSTAHRSMRDFPQELVENVIDRWTHKDAGGTDAMKVCSLVCKRWLPRSRFHLFSRVTLDADNFLSFIDIVDSNSLPILSFIQHLKLRFAGRPFDEAFLGRIHQCPNLRGIEVNISGMSANPEHNTHFYQALQTHLPLLASNSASFSCFEFRLSLIHI